MKDRWKTNLSWWDVNIRFAFLIPFSWGFWNMQHKVAPQRAGKREDVIAQMARGLAQASKRAYEECYADIKCEFEYFDKNGIKGWMKK